MTATPPTTDTRTSEAMGLMAALARGDRAALAGLIALYGRGVRIFAAHQLGEEAEAEDIAQEVFVRVWTHAARYDPAKGGVSTWIWRIAANLCADRRRRRAVRRILGLETVAEDALPETDQPEAERIIAGRQDLYRLRAALRQLPDRQRQAILMRSVGELGTAEIAAALGIGTGAAEQLLVRARAGLRRMMGDEENDRS